MCDSDISALTAWQLTMTVEDGSQLTKSGREEQLEMGRRYRKRFPGLLDQTYAEEKFQVCSLFRYVKSKYKTFECFSYQFRHTIKKRTEDSSVEYAKGAFPVEDVHIPEAFPEDKILRVSKVVLKYIAVCN